MNSGRSRPWMVPGLGSATKCTGSPGPAGSPGPDVLDTTVKRQNSAAEARFLAGIKGKVQETCIDVILYFRHVYFGGILDIEFASMVINLITALAAIAGVGLATYLGKKAVTIAAETVERASLDYAAGRADLVTEARVATFEAMAELKASLHVFWKEDPQELLSADENSARAVELTQQRNAAEADAHRAMYRLQGAGERLREVLPSAEILQLKKPRKKGAGIVREVLAPVGVDMPEIIQLVHLYERGAMALYLSLVVDHRYADPKLHPDMFTKEFMGDLKLDVAESIWLPRVQKWLADQLSVITDQTTPEIIAINFVESYLDVCLATAVHDVTDPVLAASRAGVVVRTK